MGDIWLFLAAGVVAIGVGLSACWALRLAHFKYIKFNRSRTFKKQARRYRYWTPAIILGLLSFPVITYLLKFYSHPISSTAAEWGQMGDFFGGMLNPILAFASFIALLYTVRIQSEELHLTREELKKSVYAQESSVKNQISQLHQQRNTEEFKHLCEMLNSWFAVTERHEFAEKIVMDSVVACLEIRKMNEDSVLSAAVVTEVVKRSNFLDVREMAYIQAAMNAALVFTALDECNNKFGDNRLDNVINAFAPKVSDKLVYSWLLSRCQFKLDIVAPRLKPFIEQWLKNFKIHNVN